MFVFFFSSRRRHTRWPRDWSSDVCSSDLKSQKIESLDLTPPEITPSHPDFDVARELVADKIEEASESSEQDKGAVSAPGGDLSAAAGVDAGLDPKIGRASCRERGEAAEGAAAVAGKTEGRV